MEYKVVWSPKAKQGFFEVVKYLEANWSPHVVDDFLKKTFTTIKRIAQKPFSSRASITSGCYEVLVTKHNLMIYRVKDEMVQVIIIWDTRRNPKKKMRAMKTGMRSFDSTQKR
ncbi:MAG: type II toxin-antitoxin system RelE/ParE family toxin [Flavobacteriales bacterium]|nr:type II toxin-antitoxin system RelE/ParE family toxin [Flavobacteriales bacterium]